MNDYKRLVSYIYSYPGNVKDKNTGFARVQVRNGQFKLELSLNNVHTDTPEIFGVYLMVRNGHKFNTIKLDNVIINSGCGTYKDLLNPANIRSTGYTFSDICGIAIANTDNNYYRMYTLWDDNPFNPSDVLYTDLSPDISDNADNTVTSINNTSDNNITSINNTSDNADNNATSKSNISDDADNTVISKDNISDNTDSDYVSLYDTSGISSVTLKNNSDNSSSLTSEINANINTANAATNNNETAANKNSLTSQPEIYVTAADSSFTGNSCSAKHNSDVNNSGIDKKVTNDKYHNKAIEKLFKNADYIDAFDNDYYYDCIEISPEQLKALPADDINLTGNSFIIHGYYNFRHLLLGRVCENDNGTHYFIGVPGMYCNRERFMASMYGFGNFKKSHRSDYTNPYFGYWYQEI